MNTAIEPNAHPYLPESIQGGLVAADRDMWAREVELVSKKNLLTQLTRREHEVLRRIVKGEANKVIAIDLGISQRTVEKHRERIMHKMCARSLAALIKMTILYSVRGTDSLSFHANEFPKA
jgi:FixJ family two-component response regulator